MAPYMPKGFIPLAEAVDRVCRRNGGDPSQFRPSSGAGSLAPLGAAFAHLSAIYAEHETGAKDPFLEAEQDLRAAFAENDLPAFLQPDDGGEHERVPVSVWRSNDGAKAFMSGRADWVPETVTLPGRGGSTDTWLARTAGRVIVRETDLDAWFRGDSIQLPRQAEALGQPSGGAHRVQRAWSAAELLRWYRGRVDEWPAEASPPSEVHDLRDALRVFPGVTREAVRAIRRENAPEAWKKQGRRKSRGKA